MACQKILHVAAWYPNSDDQIEGHFIKEQIDSLHAIIPSDVIAIRIHSGRLKFSFERRSAREQVWSVQIPSRSWLLLEVVSCSVLALALVKARIKNYHLVNFHIAYPLLTFFNLLTRLAGCPYVLSEHWSAYHFNFGVSKPLPRVQKIFGSQRYLLTVSNALKRDILNYSGALHLKCFVVPNVVNDIFFRPMPARNPQEFILFFMISAWEHPKNPFVIIAALGELKKSGYRFQLHLAGYGSYMPLIRDLIERKGLTEVTRISGKLEFRETAEAMQEADFFLHASGYETFSLVCAEAIASGTPVIASAVGGIPELINDTNGVLVDKDDELHWENALSRGFQLRLNRNKIRCDAEQRFKSSCVGARYASVLNDILENYAK